VGDEGYDSDEVAQIRHFNSQATTILLASLCREEYNKVQGLKSAKEIWDVLKTAHEGDEVTKITKRETIEGELGRFVLNQGEEPQAMYNRLKTLVNQVRNLGSTKWDDHEMVNVILRSLVFHNPTQVQLICGDPRYKLMSSEEVIGKFVSFELMVKDSKHIVNLEQGATSTPEVQLIAFKEKRKKRKKSLHQIGSPLTPPSSTTRIWRSSLRAFAKSSSKGGGETTNPAPRGYATNVVSPVILLLNVQRLVIVTGATTRGERRRRRRSITRGRASDEDAANIAVNKGLLFPNVGHKCFMAKDGKNKKVQTRITPKYTTSSDEGSSSEDEDDLLTLLPTLTCNKKKN
jgi:hypothetical protein